MMHRNLDRRVEALVRLSAPEHIQELHDLFDLAMDPGTSSWHLDTGGVWKRAVGTEDEPLVDLQDRTMSAVQGRRRKRSVR
jgi:polyphosphate kinase